MDATLPLALIIGSEGKGMSRLLKEKCDFLYHLPMVGHVTSFKCVCCRGYTLYEVLRVRRPVKRIRRCKFFLSMVITSLAHGMS